MIDPRIIGLKWLGTSGRTWEVIEMVAPGLYRVVTADKVCVSEMYAADIRAAVKADAKRKLNDAAPDLLAALKYAATELQNLRDLLKGCRLPEPTMLAMALEKAAAAIAKARGE